MCNANEYWGNPVWFINASYIILKQILLYLSSWCLVMVEWLFLAVPRSCLRFVIVVFPDHTHLLFLYVSYLAFGRLVFK